MKTLFILILSMLMTVSIFSQTPTVSGNIISDVQNNMYAAEIQISVDVSAELGEMILRYKFDEDVMEWDSGTIGIEFSGANYDTDIIEGHNGVTKFVEITIIFNSGNAYVVTSAPITVAIIYFSIIDATQNAGFCPLNEHFTGTDNTHWSNGTWFCDETPLPVELTSFVANTVNNVVTLNWVTATEINNYGFEIQRNGDAIGFVSGNGNSNSVKTYSFTDTPTSTGTYSYRLKQVDNDGTYEYSDAVETVIVVDGYTLSQNYPNPFNPSTTIKYEIKSAGDVTLKIYDVIGNEVAILVNEHQESGIYYMDFGTSSLTSGVYIYRLSVGDISLVKKMTLLK